MLVDVQVSSMNTSRAGSRSSWFSNQASRRVRTSGRSCSDAWAAFFERQAVAVKEGPDRPDRGLDPGLHPQPLLHLGDRDIGLGFDQAQQVVPVRVELRALRLSLLAGAPLARLASPARPHDRGRDPNAEPLRRLTGRHAGVDHPIPQVLAVRPRHSSLRRFATEDSHISAQP